MMSNLDSKSLDTVEFDEQRRDEVAAYQDELVLSELLDSLSDAERQTVQVAAQHFDFNASRRDWCNVVEQLSLTLPAVEPDSRILASLLNRIESENQRTAVRASDHPAAESLTRADAKKSLVVHRATEAKWRSAGQAGSFIRLLNHDRTAGRSTFLLKIDAGCQFPTHDHDADEECLVLSGDIQDGELSFGPGDYFRAAAGTRHADLSTREGCVCMITTAIATRH